MPKVVSFQIVQGYANQAGTKWSPDVVALCEDGSLWSIGLYEFHHNKDDGKWRKMTGPKNVQEECEYCVDPHGQTLDSLKDLPAQDSGETTAEYEANHPTHFWSK